MTVLSDGPREKAAPASLVGPGETPIPFWLGIERKWWVLCAVGVGSLMSTIDGSVVNTIAPVIMKDFAIDLPTVEWVTMIYLLVIAGLLLTFGRLGDMIGHKQVFLLGFGFFVVASILCSWAPSPLLLIAMRGLQAVGGAMLFANGPAIVTGAFPARQRGQALGSVSVMTYLGLMIGPALGGYLTDNFGWRAVFLVNVPIGLVAVALAQAAIAPDDRHAKERFDPFGALTFLVGLSALLLALSHGETWGWTSTSVLTLIAASLVLLGAFVFLEGKVSVPMLDLSLFRNRIFSAATASAILNYICIYSVILLIPFFLIHFRGLEPGQTGMLISAQAVTMMIFAPISGTLSDRFGSRVISSVGMAILAVALLGIATLDQGTDAIGIALRLMAVGLGTGIFVSPNNSALMGAAPKNRQGVASAITGEARTVGMVLGVAFAGAVFTILLSAHGGSIGPDPNFVPAFRGTFVVTAVVAAIGVPISLLRGRPS